MIIVLEKNQGMLCVMQVLSRRETLAIMRWSLSEMPKELLLSKLGIYSKTHFKGSWGDVNCQKYVCKTQLHSQVVTKSVCTYLLLITNVRVYSKTYILLDRSFSNENSFSILANV